ncbi:MAG: tetratricopeptide repeat protein [Deltaproteobacteria bacterium]|nr:tetratricopeptide repeat protein [Deltaproteobacteria bacterium]
MAPSKLPPHCKWNRPRRASAILGPFLLVLILPLGVARAQDNAVKARALVNSAIQMTNSDEAVKLLWQATEIDPTLEDPYVYLGVYYNSRSDFANMVKVYQKLIKYRPNEVSAYLNIGEAYMSFTPPRLQEALSYYQKAYALDPKNSWTALRIGEIFVQNGNREQATKYLREALADTKNSAASAEAERLLRQMGTL